MKKKQVNVLHVKTEDLQSLLVTVLKVNSMMVSMLNVKNVLINVKLVKLQQNNVNNVHLTELKNQIVIVMLDFMQSKVNQPVKLVTENVLHVYHTQTVKSVTYKEL